MTGDRDGFVIRTHSGEEVHFVPCDMNGRMREKVELGLAQRLDLDRFYVEDTRSAERS